MRIMVQCQKVLCLYLYCFKTANKKLDFDDRMTLILMLCSMQIFMSVFKFSLKKLCITLSVTHRPMVHGEPFFPLILSLLMLCW